MSSTAQNTRLGIIADTHGQLHPRLPELFSGVDAILHAGDIGKASVLEKLREIAPVHAVAGNVDDFRLGDAGEDLLVEIAGSRIYLRHIIGRPHRLDPAAAGAIARLRPEIIVFGHSHLPHDEVVDGVLFFNPASAGPRRFDYPRSVGFLEKRRGGWRGRHVALDGRDEAIVKRMNQLSRGS